MKEYTWTVWQNNRLAGYVVAYSEWEAYAKASKMSRATSDANVGWLDL